MPHEKDKLQKEEEDGENDGKQPAAEAEELGLRAGRRIDVIDSMDGEENRAAEKAEWRCGAVISAFLSMRHGRIHRVLPIQHAAAEGNGREGASAWILRNWF